MMFSSRSSTVYSYRDDTEMNTYSLRQDLEEHFRPVFQQFVYGGEKIALHDLRRLLENRRYRRLLPPDKVHDLLDLADFNPGKALTYNEFVKQIVGYSEDEFDGIESSAEVTSKSGIKKRDKNSGFLFYICRNSIPNIELGDYLHDYRWCPPPFFMIAISITQIVFFALSVENLKNTTVPMSALEGVEVNSSLIYKPTRRYEAWRFITYAFFHQGYVHLILTLVYQLFFGIPLEIVFKFWRLMIIYFVGVITGSLLQSVCDHYVGMVGGSAGIYAIMTAHCLTFVYNWKQLNRDIKESALTRILCSVPLRFVIILIIALVDIGLAVYRRFYLPDPYKIGLCGHGGGILAGIFVAKPFLRDIKRYPWQQNSGWLALFTFLALIGGAVVFNVAYKGYPETDWS
ncbi:rhomboid-related protein 2 [Patella vulgata]|uniref:rhomboid-related protein 2 n=1 Tax=Patella vulgata TaxID=6465 RepID=UPI0024A9813A|nr:rhomboid-related protein 2 [Patella vulgata]